MSISDISELVGLLLALPTILLAGWVVVAYWTRAREAWDRFLGGGQTTEVDLLVMGICLGFTGAVLDNIYWTFAWGADFLNHSSREFWFTYGPTSNIPFRQLAGIAAAILHLYPVVTTGRTSNRFITIIAVATLIMSVAILIEKFF